METISMKLIRESEWMRVYQVAPKHLHYESKFLRDNLYISAQDVRSRWPVLSSDEQFEFALAFTAKGVWSAEDVEILNYLMRSDNDDVRHTIAIPVALHCDRARAREFLLHEATTTSTDRSNYYQALTTLSDSQTMPELRGHYEQYREQLTTAESFTGREKEFRNLCRDYLYCCAALWSIEGSPEFERAIREYEVSPDQIVADCARRILHRK